MHLIRVCCLVASMNQAEHVMADYFAGQMSVRPPPLHHKFLAISLNLNLTDGLNRPESSFFSPREAPNWLDDVFRHGGFRKPRNAQGGRFGVAEGDHVVPLIERLIDAWQPMSSGVSRLVSWCGSLVLALGSMVLLLGKTLGCCGVLCGDGPETRSEGRGAVIWMSCGAFSNEKLGSAHAFGAASCQIWLLLLQVIAPAPCLFRD